MQVPSSMTIMPPEPIIEPSASRVSKSTGRSSLAAGRQPPEGPPVWTALKALPPGTPPPAPKTISRRLVPIGTSTRPVLTTLPTSEKILVPGEPAVPMARYQSAPFRTICGTFAQVSTLLRFVGRPQSPRSERWMSRRRGTPRRPSSEAIIALASPQTKAPPPRLTRTSNECSLPRMRSPSRPSSRACSTARVMRATATGYSWRT